MDILKFNIDNTEVEIKDSEDGYNIDIKVRDDTSVKINNRYIITETRDFIYLDI